MMQWRGAWRPVTNMWDQNNIPTTMAVRAVKVVLFLTKGEWVACAVAPGEVVERFDRDPNARVWEYI
jgi:hypothetical protein